MKKTRFIVVAYDGKTLEKEHGYFMKKHQATEYIMRHRLIGCSVQQRECGKMMYQCWCGWKGVGTVCPDHHVCRCGDHCRSSHPEER